MDPIAISGPETHLLPSPKSPHRDAFNPSSFALFFLYSLVFHGPSLYVTRKIQNFIMYMSYYVEPPEPSHKDSFFPKKKLSVHVTSAKRLNFRQLIIHKYSHCKQLPPASVPFTPAHVTLLSPHALILFC